MSSEFSVTRNIYIMINLYDTSKELYSTFIYLPFCFNLKQKNLGIASKV